MKRIYISGPMTGLPEFNFPAFNAEAARLRALGYEVVNPAEINMEAPGQWHECLRRDVVELMKCDTVALMDGWMNSNGAHLEMHIAHRVGMEIILAADITAPAPADSIDMGAMRAHDPLPAFDLIAHLYRQRDFSLRTFGPGVRLNGVVDHIRKELIEILDNPGDVFEWIDVVLLALDGACRHGHSPEGIAAALAVKQARNESRHWPDWRQYGEDQAIQHVRVEAAPAEAVTS